MPLPEEVGSSESATYDGPPSFNPYDITEEQDPKSVQPTSSGPAQSSDAPGFGDTSGADGQEPKPVAEEEEPVPEFDPRHRTAFEGLLYLGRVEKTVPIFGHEFVLRTLTTEQMAEIGLIVKPYNGTQAENAVYQAAVVAASVVTVDGKPLPSSIEIDNSDELTRVKFPYVMKKWMPPVRERIYNESFRLEVQVREVLDAMGEARG